ncbi:hypothetical protein FNU79_10035 [Deinococcus detaillensis]|uniref:Uncharacterized protein n=1 Tax=Deinococcus detaillensis TaxID=2592048 RepID=A0A553UZ79_9DEIO|nr:hypothetical protein [Deinococcus detaillensis]TSA85522.1 hypothetical protein FNU79_10035 [Deinococcus detaillensis]
MTDFALKRTVEADVDAVLEWLKTALTAEGLGVLYTLEFDPSIAALLPCGAFVIGTQTGTEMGFLDPALAIGRTGNEALGPLGNQARGIFQRVLAEV